MGAVALGLALALTVLTGCTSIPDGRRAVTGFDIEGAKHIDSEELEDKLATRETSKFMALFRGVVYEYDVYDRYTLEQDLSRIERYYRARGYYSAKVRVARVHDIGDDKVHVEIQVDEGEPVRVVRFDLAFTDPVPEEVRRAVEDRVRAVVGRNRKPFDEEKFETAEKEISRGLANRGYAAALTTRAAEVDLIRNEAILHFKVTPGEPSVFGEVTFVGRGEIPEAAIRRAFAIRPGDEFSQAALDDGRQELLDLGVFSTVDAVPDLSKEGHAPPDAEGRRRRIVPVKVELEVSKLRTIRVGGGVELSSSRFDVHGLVGWRGENTFGNLRRVELTLQPGVVFYPTSFSNLDAPTDYLFFQRTRAQLRQPGFLEARTTGIVTAEYGVFPQLFPQKTPNVVGYHELSTRAGVQRTFRRFFANPSYGFQANFPYNAVGVSPQSLSPILVSYLELLSYLDFRNDPLKPTRGAYLANTLQFAGGPLGGTADDVRIQPEARGYIPLSKRVSIATRLAFGFLFPRSYSTNAQAHFDDPTSPAGADRSALTRDYQILYFRGLFGGGPNSNRGYPLRGIGPHDAIPYLVPAVTQAQGSIDGGCDPTNPSPPRECLLPTGGLSQWESSLELRFKITGPLLAATFCDAGDVSPREVNLRFDRLHLSCGAGARYDTPAGPIRLDIGYRLPGLQTLGGSFGEGKPAPFLGLPIALSFGIGEAF